MRVAISVVLAFIACRSPQPAASQSQGPDDQLRVPNGFKISVFAQNVQGVRYMVLGPGNAIYASQPASGLVVKITDRNNDGVADTVVTVASGLGGPFGIAFRGDTIAGVANLLRTPGMPTMRPFVSMVGVTNPEIPRVAELTEHLAAHSFERARTLGIGLEAEADDAHVHLALALERLPALETDQLLQFIG